MRAQWGRHRSRPCGYSSNTRRSKRPVWQRPSHLWSNNMKSIVKHGVVAALCTAPLLSHAFWSLVDRGATEYDSGTQMRTDGRHGAWRDRLWQGQVFYCERKGGSGSSECVYTFGQSVSYSFAKTIGANFGVKVKKVVDLGLNSSLTWTKTDTHIWNVNRPVSQGYMVRPYIYVERRWTWGHYFGHWKRMSAISNPNGRGGTITNYRYQWFWARDGWWGAHEAQSNDSIATFAIWKPR